MVRAFLDGQSAPQISLVSPDEASAEVEQLEVAIADAAGATVGVVAKDDALVEGQHSVFVRHELVARGGISSSWTTTAATPVRVSVTDNDEGEARFDFGGQGPSVALREGGSGSFRLALNAPADQEVTVAVSAPSARVTVSPSALVFTADNYALSQRVDVSASSDGSATGPLTYSLALSARSLTPAYSGLTAAVTVTGQCCCCCCCCC